LRRGLRPTWDHDEHIPRTGFDVMQPHAVARGERAFFGLGAGCGARRESDGKDEHCRELEQSLPYKHGRPPGCCLPCCESGPADERVKRTRIEGAHQFGQRLLPPPPPGLRDRLCQPQPSDGGPLTSQVSALLTGRYYHCFCRLRPTYYFPCGPCEKRRAEWR